MFALVGALKKLLKAEGVTKDDKNNVTFTHNDDLRRQQKL